jgi:hypothetical protein
MAARLSALRAGRTLPPGFFIFLKIPGPCYLSRGDHGKKIRSRKQRTDIGKYSFVNRTIQLWNQLPADVLGNLSCKPSNFRKKIRKVINKAR